MMIYKRLPVLVLMVLMACNSPKTETKTHSVNTHTIASSIDTIEVVVNDTKAHPDTTSHNNTSVIATPKPTQKAKQTTAKHVVELGEEVPVQTDLEDTIIPGYVKNEVTKVGENYDFKRVVKGTEDRSVGCSGSVEVLSFTIVNPTDTFVIENDQLHTIDFKYHIEGGLYWEDGENPYQGVVKGMLLEDNAWQIQIDVWMTMITFENKTIEKYIRLNETFRR